MNLLPLIAGAALLGCATASQAADDSPGLVYGHCVGYASNDALTGLATQGYAVTREYVVMATIAAEQQCRELFAPVLNSALRQGYTQSQIEMEMHRTLLGVMLNEWGFQ